jgi:ribosomal protein L20
VETGCRGGQGSPRAVAPSERKEEILKQPAGYDATRKTMYRIYNSTNMDLQEMEWKYVQRLRISSV